MLKICLAILLYYWHLKCPVEIDVHQHAARAPNFRSFQAPSVMLVDSKSEITRLSMWFAEVTQMTWCPRNPSDKSDYHQLDIKTSCRSPLFYSGSCCPGQRRIHPYLPACLAHCQHLSLARSPLYPSVLEMYGLFALTSVIAVHVSRSRLTTIRRLHHLQNIHT
jgi:hypothetical protein